MKVSGRALVLSSILATLAVAASCGSSDNQAKGPGGQAISANPAPSQAQFVISDKPSSVGPGDPVPDNRPGLKGGALASYNQGLGAFAMGDLANAKKYFQEATQADAKAHQAFYSLGVVQERMKDSGAGSSYRQAYTIVSDYEPAIVAHAFLMARKGQTSDAETLLNQKKNQMPKSAAVLAALAEVKSLGGDTGSAQKLAQEALKLNPDYRPAMVILARDHYRQRRLKLALYALEAILDGIDPKDENPARDPNNAEARLLRGLIYREEGRRFAATEEFRMAVERRPDLVEARVQLAAALMEAGNAEQALPLLDGAVKYDSENVAARLLLGDAYRLQSKFVEAKKELDWVIAKDSSMAQAHYDMGLIYLFAPSLAGMTPKQQVQAATASLKKYQELRSRAVTDDSDELLTYAKLKEGEIDAANAPPPPPPPPPSAATPAADAGAPVADAGK